MHLFETLARFSSLHIVVYDFVAKGAKMLMNRIFPRLMLVLFTLLKPKISYMKNLKKDANTRLFSHVAGFLACRLKRYKAQEVLRFHRFWQDF